MWSNTPRLILLLIKNCVSGIHSIGCKQSFSLWTVHECENWDWGRAIPRKGRRKWDFRCSASCTNHTCMEPTDMTENIWFGKQKNASEWRQLLSVLLVIYLMLRSFDIQEFRGGSGIGWDEIPSSLTISNRVEGSTYICRSSSKLWTNMNFSRRN